MRINESYCIQILVGNIGKTNALENIYESVEALRKKHPADEIVFGYVIVDAHTNTIPDGMEDWYSSPEKAMEDFETKLRQAS